MVGDMMKLLMITHCFCRSPQLVRTIPNLQMVSRRGSLSVPNNVRLGALHEQIKCGLVCLWNKYLSDILAKCHRGLRSTTAKHISKALPLICTFLGLAIILEKIEDTLHDTPNENETYRAADPISSSFHDIEEGFTLLLDLCRMSYGRDAALQVRAKLPVDWSSPERDLITDLQCLVSKHRTFLPSFFEIEGANTDAQWISSLLAPLWSFLLPILPCIVHDYLLSCCFGLGKRNASVRKKVVWLNLQVVDLAIFLSHVIKTPRFSNPTSI